MFQKIKKIVVSKTFLVFFSIIASVGMITGSFVYKTKAATMGSHGLYIFGGMINDIELCCNGLKLEIGNPRSGTFMFTPGLSKLYMWYNISTDQCVLGDAYPFGVCIKPASWPPCSDEEEVDGTIRQMGTTLEGPMEGSCEDSGGGGGGGGTGGGSGGASSGGGSSGGESSGTVGDGGATGSGGFGI
jgi:uncharacterized membrane protein YgcG